MGQHHYQMFKMGIMIKGKINNSDTPPQNNRSPIAPPNLNNDDDHNADVSQAFKKINMA